jgi:hypothetical protein
MTTKEERARDLAQRMPLVNFPASTPFADWLRWGRLKSRAALDGKLDAGAEPTSFPELRERHVFVYAGPSCFFKRHGLGDAAMYFRAGSEQGSVGSATPFDTGSLEDPDARLQPWASLPTGDRWSFLCSQFVPLTEFRMHFEGWLARSYDDPERYLESAADREVAGRPDRLDLPEILEHNGQSGRSRYHGASPLARWADRRAWTWEVQVRGELKWDAVMVLHVPPDLEVIAQDAADMWASTYGGVTPVVKTIPSNLPPGPESVYLDSGRVLRELTR